MGIHGNATCQMVLEGAVGTMVGQPNKGLQAMFVMMNTPVWAWATSRWA